MDVERFRQVDDLLQAALARPIAERHEFLAQACGQDDALRVEVEALLDADKRPGLLDAQFPEVVSACLHEQQVRLPHGQHLGPYRVVRFLGAGGMGEVYLAEDCRLARLVALKLLPAAWTDDPRRVNRFAQEARAASTLNHPNIATIYDVGTAEGHHYIATEYVAGETLRARLSKRLDVGDALAIAAQIGSALSAAHAAGIVHRDLKPENVIVRHDGVVKIVDFGLAKLLTAQSVTQAAPDSLPGLLLGTTAYMSPEQAQGLEVDRRSDIFSFGVVLFELLVGRPPFAGATASQVIASILRDEPPPVSRAGADVPTGLDSVVANALRKDRGDRYQIVDALVSDLRDVSLQMTSPPSWWHRLRLGGGTRYRARFAALLVAVVAMALVAILPMDRSEPIESIVILPFTVGETDSDIQYLADGLADGLNRRLSRIAQLRVTVRSSVGGTPRPNGSVQTVSPDANSSAVLSGRVVRQGNQLSTHVELTDSTGRRLWATDDVRPVEDFRSLQTVIATHTADHLHLQLTADERRHLQREETFNADAYQLYTKGRYFWNRRTARDLEMSVTFFERAIAIDPKYPLAHAGLADAFLSLGSSGGSVPAAKPRREYLATAKKAALEALSLDGDLVEARVSLATALYWLDWDWSAAETEYRRALALNPRYPTAHHRYGVYLAFMRRFDEAIAAMQQAEALDPVSVSVAADFGLVYSFARQWDAAIAQHRKTLELAPDYSRSRIDLIDAYLQKGMLAAAAAELDAKHGSNGSVSASAPQTSVDRINASLGRPTRTREILRTMVEQRNRGELVGGTMLIAELHARLGEDDEAFRWLEIAYRERQPLLFRIFVDARWENYRIYSDPRWAELERRFYLPFTRR